MKRFILIAFVLIAALKTESYPCTIVMVSGSNTALAGSNEDSVFPLTMIWYVPATGNNYGRVCFGYRMIMNSVQGGMNEKGLFVDGNSLGRQGWRADDSKQKLAGPLLDMILARCATVGEVKQFFNSYNTPDLDRVVEFLGTKDSYSVEVVRDALDATHVEGDNSITVYSFICDLKSGDIYVYNYMDFANPLRFNLREELNKGAQQYFLGSLFTRRSPDYEQFIADGPVKMVERGYSSGMINGTLFYGILTANYPEAFGRKIGIDVLSRVGCNLMDGGNRNDGIIFLERNVVAFPDSARTHFEMANAYLKTNNKEKAIAEYNKTLEINPDHKEALLALDNLQNR